MVDTAGLCARPGVAGSGVEQIMPFEGREQGVDDLFFQFVRP